MFSTVRSFLFGEAAQEMAAEENQENQNADLSTKDTELGWVLVNQQEADRDVEPVMEPENPLENLLIEHPSMSVYCTQHGPQSEWDHDSGIHEVNCPPSDQSVHRPAAVAPLYRQPHVLTAHLSVDNRGLVRLHQSQRIKHVSKHLNRKHFQRSNKCSFASSCQKQGSKHNRFLHPCGSKSGRRSQRAQ